MITKEQLAELHDGDIVELTKVNSPRKWLGDSFRGPVRVSASGSLIFGATILRGDDGARSPWCDTFDLNIIKRAPRPLYVNHERVHPAPGDVVRGPEEPGVEPGTWTYTFDGWVSTRSGNRLCPVPRPARLLVDGETGQVVR